MDRNLILYPMMALVAWTFFVLLQVPKRRFKAARERRVTAADFKYGESERVPPDVRIPNLNLINLLETPVLFYVACLTLFVTSVDALAVGLAWVYVATRVAHSAVHLTYNNVFHRLRVFALSIFVLMALWVRVAFGLF